MNGVIWSKTQQTFVPISSVPVYAIIQQERFKQSRALETNNFQQQNLTLTSFQEPYFLNFYDNDKKISGVCGEMWTLLSESLNFTLHPVRVGVDGLGLPEKNFTYTRGLLGMISRNETSVIPKVEMFIPRLSVTDFTIPLWKNRFNLYIHREVMHDSTWMIQVFSWKIWCSILVVYILLSVCTFVTQNVSIWIENKYKNASFNEHLFYNFGNLCNQSYIPENLEGKSRILEVTLGLFCSIIYMAFGAVLFIYIAKRLSVPPFDSFDSLINDTKYNVVSLKGSTEGFAFKIVSTPTFVQARKAKRFTIATTIAEMHKMACFSRRKKYAIYQGEVEHKVSEHSTCSLTATGEPYTKVWVASGTAKNFKYKRTVDLGILKLMEVGLLDMLKDRWLKRKIKQNDDDNMPKPIEIQQVSLIIAVICCGAVIAFIIFIIEKIVFVYKHKQL